MRDIVVIDYTNHRNERAMRVIRPMEVWIGSTAWHQDTQWLLKAFDLEKLGTRDFAMANIHSWQEYVKPEAK